MPPLVLVCLGGRLEAQAPRLEQPSGRGAAVILVEFFADIGSGRCGLEALDIHIAAHFASEIDEDAIRVLRTNHPDIEFLEDVCGVGAEVVERISSSHPSAHVVLLAGPPCVDVSRLKANRQGAHAPQSGLHTQVQRIYHLLL